MKIPVELFISVWMTTLQLDRSGAAKVCMPHVASRSQADGVKLTGVVDSAVAGLACGSLDELTGAPFASIIGWQKLTLTCPI